MKRSNQYAMQSAMQPAMQQQPIYYICTMPPNGFNFPSFPPPNFIEQHRIASAAAKRPATEKFINNELHPEKKAKIEVFNTDKEKIKQVFKPFGNLENTPADFEKLMNYIKNDMDLAISIMEKKDHLFIPFERNAGETIQLANKIKAYAVEMHSKDLKFCKYNDACRCRETCSYIHEKIYTSIIDAFSYFQYSGNKFIDNSWPVSASFINKNLNELENVMWYLKSRINYKY